jgi:hypothetical protein
LVAGVISTAPGFVLGAKHLSLALSVNGEGRGEVEPGERPLLALLGRVPVKATTENGPIRPGDLLTSASKPGYAMRCEDIHRCEGAIIGKALEALDESEGAILILLVR